MGRQTTITLDEDVAAKLESEAERKGVTPADIANDVLRRNLHEAKITRQRFVVRARDLGAAPGVNFDCAWKLLHDMDESTSK